MILASHATKCPRTYWLGEANTPRDEVDDEWSAGTSHEPATKTLDASAKASQRSGKARLAFIFSLRKAQIRSPLTTLATLLPSYSLILLVFQALLTKHQPANINPQTRYITTPIMPKKTRTPKKTSMPKETSLIEAVFASWKDLEEVVDVETPANPQIVKWTKADVKNHFDTHDLPPIACHALPAVGIPDEVNEINASRNNPELFQHLINNDPYWLAHRILLQAQFQSNVQLTQCQTYLLAEEGEAVVLVNGRPLTELERAQVESDVKAVDLSHTLPVEKKLVKGHEVILPEYTLYCIVAKKDSLITTGCILPRCRQGTYEKSGDDDDDKENPTKTSSMNSGTDDGLSSALSDILLESDTDKPNTGGVHGERRLGDGLEWVWILASGSEGEDGEWIDCATS